MSKHKAIGLIYFKEFKNVTVKGLGTGANHDCGETYNYIEFKDEDGKISTIDRPSLIMNNMAMSFQMEAKGDFYFVHNNEGHFVLVASNVNGERRTVPHFSIATLLMGAGCASLGLMIVFFYIMLPLFIFLRIGRNRDMNTIRDYLIKEGFKDFENP